MPRGILSKFDKTEDPVVVSAETDSNHESTKGKERDDQKKGRLAKNEVHAQLMVVSRKASRTFNSVLPSVRFERLSKVPTNPVTKAEIANPCHPSVS